MSERRSAARDLRVAAAGTVHEPADPAAQAPDQAAGLRRLFGPPPARVLPVLVARNDAGANVAALVRFAQAHAASGQRTLVLDAARVQFAAALGLRARFDLLHAQRGECTLAQALLDAGPDLAVLPVARVVGSDASTYSDVCAQALAATDAVFAADSVLLLADASQMTRVDGVAGGEVIVPLPADRAGWPGILGAMGTLADHGDMVAFRLLFPAWDAESAASLYTDLARAWRARRHPELRFGGAVPVARDWAHVARAGAEWQLAILRRPQWVRTV